MLRGAILAASVALFACGGGEPTAPVLADLAVMPAEVRAGETIQLRMSYSDPDGDLAGGTAELALRRLEEARGTTYPTPLSGEESVRGVLTLSVKLPVGALPGAYEVAVTVVDAAGRRSNALTGSVQLLE
jgi:hypothetical protein